MDRPAETLATGDVTLRRWRASDADLAFGLVQASAEHLRPWMTWAEGYAPSSARQYVQLCEREWQSGDQFNYLISVAGHPAGSAGLMARIGPGGLEIGYWVNPGFTGRGVATRTAGLLTEAALALPGIDRVEIFHDQRNVASGRVAAKLGYQLVATQPARSERAPADSGISNVWRITR